MPLRLPRTALTQIILSRLVQLQADLEGHVVSEMRLEELEGKLGFLGDALTAMARLDAYIVAEKVNRGLRDARA